MVKKTKSNPVGRPKSMKELDARARLKCDLSEALEGAYNNGMSYQQISPVLQSVIRDVLINREIY